MALLLTLVTSLAPTLTNPQPLTGPVGRNFDGSIDPICSITLPESAQVSAQLLYKVPLLQ
jgi:hypothetical protein